jgi:thioredoxin
MKKISIITIVLLSIITIGCGARAQENLPVINSDKKGVIHITYADFITKIADLKASPDKWHYLGDKPAIIDFYADWCGYCKKLSPILEELAIEYKDQIYIYKVNTDMERDIAKAFGVRALPTLLFIPMEGELQVAQGAIPKEDLKRAIETVLLSKDLNKNIVE